MNLWILSRLSDMVQSCDQHFKSYDLHFATQSLYNFWVLDFCDIYLVSKTNMSAAYIYKCTFRLDLTMEANTVNFDQTYSLENSLIWVHIVCNIGYLRNKAEERGLWNATVIFCHSFSSCLVDWASCCVKMTCYLVCVPC